MAARYDLFYKVYNFVNKNLVVSNFSCDSVVATYFLYKTHTQDGLEPCIVFQTDQ